MKKALKISLVAGALLLAGCAVYYYFKPYPIWVHEYYSTVPSSDLMTLRPLRRVRMGTCSIEAANRAGEIFHVLKPHDISVLPWDVLEVIQANDGSYRLICLRRPF